MYARIIFHLFLCLLLAGTANAQNYQWAFNTGGTDQDEGNSIATDVSGNVYVTGYFMDTVDFDPSGNIANLTSNGNRDIFVAKYDANGNYVWAFNVGGTSDDRGNGITTDVSGNVYVTGYFMSTADFDPSGNTANLTSNGLADIFVAKYDATGNYLWAFKVGGGFSDTGYDIAIDTIGSGNVYVTGSQGGAATDIFVAKYDVNGNNLWTFNVGGSNTDGGYSISTDPAGSGDVYVTGYFYGTADFDPSGNTANLTSNGSFDIFIAKYDANGNYLWAFNVGGTDQDGGYGITTDPAGGDVYVTGSFQNTADFDPSGNTANLTSNGWYDAFVAKYDATGNYQWAFSVGGTGTDWGYGIATDPAGSGDVYVTGYFADTADFDPSGNTANLISNGSSDIFVARYDAAGNYLWAFNVEGIGTDWGLDITTDPLGNGAIYVTGQFGNTADFDPSGNTANLTSNGNRDIFVAKYDTACLLAVATVNSDTSVCIGDSVALTATGGSSYLWSPGSGLSDSTVASPVASPTATTTYMVIVSSGCDSDTAYVTVTVNPTYSFNDAPVTICDGDSTLLYGNYETVAGTYHDSLTTINNCDSVYSTILTVNPSYIINDTVVDICDGDSALIYGNYETATGTYYDSYTTVNGCDSVFSTVLTVDPVFADTDTITITQGDSTFLEGAWQTTAGIYYDTLIATNGCDSIVATTLTVVVGIPQSSISNNQFTIYPNPTTGQFTISSRQGAIKKVEVYDLFGRKVLESKEPEIDMSSYPAGLYIWRVGEARGKVVIE